MSTDTIQPRDQKETSILALSAKIGNAILLIGTAVIGLLTSINGIEWFTANLPALLGGISALVGGGVATGIAIRRMKIDKAAKALSILLCMAIAMLLQGCVFTQVELPVQGTVVKINRVAFCNAVEIPKVSYIPSTGDIMIEGYKSDGGSAAIATGAELGAKAAILGMKGAAAGL